MKGVVAQRVVVSRITVSVFRGESAALSSATAPTVITTFDCVALDILLVSRKG